MGNLGIGVDTSIATAEEVELALEGQSNDPKEIVKPGNVNYKIPFGKYNGMSIASVIADIGSDGLKGYGETLEKIISGEIKFGDKEPPKGFLKSQMEDLAKYIRSL